MQAVILDRTGTEVLETDVPVEGLAWETRDWGGFGGCSFTVPGAAYDRYRRALDHDFALLRVYDDGGTTLYEGQIDRREADGEGSRVQCLGLWSILEETGYAQIYRDDRIGPEVWRPYLGDENLEITRDGGTLRLKVRYGTYWSTNLAALVYSPAYSYSPGKFSGTYTYVEDPYHDSIEPTVRRLRAELSDDTESYTVFSVTDDATGSFTYNAAGIYPTFWWLALVGLIATQNINFGGYYLELTGLTVWRDNVTAYYASDVAKHIAGLLAAPLSSASTRIQSTDYSLNPLYFEPGQYTQATALKWCGAIGDTSGRSWRGAVWDGGLLSWYPRDLATVGYYVRPDDIEPKHISVSRDKGKWANQVTVTYEDAATGKSTTTATSTHPTYKPSAIGRTRNVTLDAGTTSTAVATQIATTYLTEHEVPPLTGKVTLTRPVLGANGEVVPLRQLRAGKLARFGFDAAGQGLVPGSDHWIASTSYRADADTCEIELGYPLDTVDLLLARAAQTARVGRGD